jgi:putative component of membrane protein insertase Oxa1/YidC/SpoIIIJ protein YidD
MGMCDIIAIVHGLPVSAHGGWIGSAGDGARVLRCASLAPGFAPPQVGRWLGTPSLCNWPGIEFPVGALAGPGDGWAGPGHLAHAPRPPCSHLHHLWECRARFRGGVDTHTHTHTHSHTRTHTHTHTHTHAYTHTHTHTHTHADLHSHTH